MRVLIVATKLPWPPHDGGRLALWLTIVGLVDAGHQVRVIAPGDAVETHPLGDACRFEAVPVRPQSWAGAAASAMRHGRSLTVARHTHGEVAAAVRRAIDNWQPHLLHVEQLQAWDNAVAGNVRSLPMVLRMQNVESDLWRAVLGIESRRVAADETRAMRRAHRVIALTEEDASALRTRLDATVETYVEMLPPPFPTQLPAGPEVDGAPALAIAGSAGWRPNREGLASWLSNVAPELSRRWPAAQVHVFGGDAIASAFARSHPPPADAATAFPANAIAVVPLRVASGIRMRILDAWARGLPVVASSVAARGLGVEHGRELLIADDAHGWIDAVAALQSPKRREDLVAAGRAYLARHHDAGALTERLLGVYRDAIDAAARR